MVLQNGEINIIADMEGTTGVKLHNNRQKLRSRFDIIKKLGQGTYGKVQLAINKDTGEEVAIKTIKKSKIETEQDLVRIQREIQIMSSVQHPHIIHIYEVFENREKIVLVMEYASGGELYDYISYKKVLEEVEARRVFRQVAAAVFYCHKNMICHRDLKLENILLDEKGCAKIADFGLSNVFDERNFLSTFCGSPLYASPEIVRGTPYCGPEVDCWSLGVLLYTLVYGAMPFDGSNFKKLVRQISEGDYYEPKVPSEASHLIRRMLTVDPIKRASIDDICNDVWVDLGEEIPLCDIAEDMCKQMPVRLDYLLALTGAPDPPSAELPIPPPPPSEIEGTTADSMSQTIETESESVAMDTEKIKHDPINEKKHKLMTTSSSTIAADNLKKPKKDNENNTDHASDESFNKIDYGIVIKQTDQNVLSRENLNTTTVTDTNKMTSKENSSIKKKVPSIKRASLSNSSSKLSKSVSTGNDALNKSNNVGLTSSTNNKSFGLKKSTTGVTTTLKNGNSNISELSPEKRKLSITSPIKKPLEIKQTTDKKPTVEMKVSSVRKVFESPPATPEVLKTAKSPLMKKSGTEESTPETPYSDSKKSLVRKGSRKAINVASRNSVSPTKTVRTSQQHHSCVPHEARMAATTAEETKKSASPPPKSVVRRISPPTPLSGNTESSRKTSLTKAPSFSSKASQGSPKVSPAFGSKPTVAVRSRSPLKLPKRLPNEKPTNEIVQNESPEEVLTNQMKSVDISDDSNRQLRGSIETTPLIQEDDSPQIKFLPRDKCQFTLLGVKSEVIFDVGGSPDEPEYVQSELLDKKEPPIEEEVDNSKIIRYVATVRRHGSEDQNEPERVTLLNIRRSETGMSDASKESETLDSGVTVEKESNKSDDICINAEKRGYSVYRSKYKSVQKFKSVLECHVDNEQCNDGVTLKVDNGESSDGMPANKLENSDSFSSAGSADDLEDVFESLTSESLFTSLLNRTRNLIERITDGDVHASNFFQSSLLGSRLLGSHEGLTSNSAAMSIFLNPPTISFRSSPVSTSNRRNYDVTRDFNRSPTTSDQLGSRRWRPSSSSTRNTTEDKDQVAFSTGSGGSASIRLRAKSSFNSNDYSSTLSGGSNDHGRRHQSRYETFRSQDDSMTSPIAESANRRREEARSDIITALFRHRNRSLDGRRPRSLYGDSDDYFSTKSTNPRGQDTYWEEDRQDITSNTNGKSSNLYGTVRRPNRYPRYTKSMSKEMDAGGDYNSSVGLRRPRSIHEILSNNLDMNCDNDDVDDDDMNVSRDYSKSGSKSVSRVGATKREEEEEFERERQVKEGSAGRSVTTTERKVSRSVSQTDDDDNSCSSSSVHVHTSSTSLQRRSAVASNCKKTSEEGDGISRQDSGVGSLHESGSVMSGHNASSVRRGNVRKYGRSVSNDLESLEEEMTRVGLRHNEQQESTKLFVRVGDDGEACKADGATTPASDSADTGSVCSDASGHGTETTSSTVKASDEESVGERIRRKSFFARFNDTTTSRVPRKSSSTATSSLRSDLSRSSSLRHRMVDDDSFVTRMHYEAPSDFYGMSSRYPQRWSMHHSSGGDSDYLPHDTAPTTPLSPRRSSFQGGCGADQWPAYLRRPSSSNWMMDDNGADTSPSCCRSTSPISPSGHRHSLPDDQTGNGIESSRNYFRQTSAPSSNTSNPGIPPASPTRRPNHLGLHTTHQMPQAGHYVDVDSDRSSTGCNSWGRHSTSTTQRPRMSSSSSHVRGDYVRQSASSIASSLMIDNLESPSEVMQKAMDLCDSLRYT